MKERIFDARRPRQGAAPAGSSPNPPTSPDLSTWQCCQKVDSTLEVVEGVGLQVTLRPPMQA